MTSQHSKQGWEYCVLSCTRLPGVDDGPRVVCRVFEPDGQTTHDISTNDAAPQAGVVRALNILGREGWELVSFDSSTNRGILKRPIEQVGGSG